MMSRVGALAKQTLLLLLGIVVGILICVVYTKTNESKAEACASEYSLTSQSLDCAGYIESYNHVHALQADLDNAVAQYLKEGKATRVSIWVRDLETKQWAATNENELYDPASLIKLPIAIAYYKVSEVEPSILSDKLEYKKASQYDDSVQDFVPPSTFTIGTQYTIADLIEDMLINSDNNAVEMLQNFLDPSVLTNTLLDLGIAIPSNMNNAGVHDFINAKTYANIFRTLYNASYLNRTDSQKILQILSKVAYPGISIPLPKGLVVAHKFGEREFVYTGGMVAKRQLHDCGIVYQTDHPYSICVMTEGTDFKNLESVISDLSILTYNEI